MTYEQYIFRDRFYAADLLDQFLGAATGGQMFGIFELLFGLHGFRNDFGSLPRSHIGAGVNRIQRNIQYEVLSSQFDRYYMTQKKEVYTPISIRGIFCV